MGQEAISIHGNLGCEVAMEAIEAMDWGKVYCSSFKENERQALQDEKAYIRITTPRSHSRDRIETGKRWSTAQASHSEPAASMGWAAGEATRSLSQARAWNACIHMRFQPANAFCERWGLGSCCARVWVGVKMCGRLLVRWRKGHKHQAMEPIGWKVMGKRDTDDQGARKRKRWMMGSRKTKGKGKGEGTAGRVGGVNWGGFWGFYAVSGTCALEA